MTISENRNSVLICSNDGFRASVSITINYRFVDELTSGNLGPFTLYGVGEWPEIARSSEPKTNEASNSTKPIEILQLRSNTLQIWAGELQAQLNSTENIFFGTTKTISAQNIPTGVVCDVNLLNNGAWFWETKKWKLSCSYDEFRNRIDLLINGNTVRGLNDGYINIETSFTVIGVGEWPELAYERQVLQSNQSMPANDVLSLSKNDSSTTKLLLRETMSFF